MIVRQLINKDINQKAFCLFAIKTEEDVLSLRTGWKIRSFGYQSPGDRSFRRFRLEIIK